MSSLGGLPVSAGRMGPGPPRMMDPVPAEDSGAEQVQRFDPLRILLHFLAEGDNGGSELHALICSFPAPVGLRRVILENTKARHRLLQHRVDLEIDDGVGL